MDETYPSPGLLKRGIRRRGRAAPGAAVAADGAVGLGRPGGRAGAGEVGGGVAVQSTAAGVPGSTTGR